MRCQKYYERNAKKKKKSYSYPKKMSCANYLRTEGYKQVAVAHGDRKSVVRLGSHFLNT